MFRVRLVVNSGMNSIAHNLARVGALALVAAGVAGCATLTESTEQTVLVQTIQDNQAVDGAGCILTNKAGRWFVTSPGRVTIQKSVGDLWIDCKKDGASSYDIVASKAGGAALWGNVVISAGLGYFIDKNSGAGFDYPATLTVIMRKGVEPTPHDNPGSTGAPIF